MSLNMSKQLHQLEKTSKPTLKHGMPQESKSEQDTKTPSSSIYKTSITTQFNQDTQEASSSPTPPKLSNTGETPSKKMKNLVRKSTTILLTIREQLAQPKLL